jgi:hypothetical protein
VDVSSHGAASSAPVLGYEERLWLRRALDRLARERLAKHEWRPDQCRGCGGHRDERNPACSYCRDRHGRRSRRASKLAADEATG